MDLFVTYAYQDADYASGLEDTLAGRGLVVGEPVSLWPGQRLLPPIDQGLHDARHAIVVVSRAFLGFSWSRKELDGLTTRSRVVAILADLVEADVAKHSPRLAVAAFPGSLSERLVRLLRPEDEGE
jgi:TIR domain